MLPLFGAFKKQFYLAGGTGLALQIGHRDSADFDFFTPDHFDVAALHSNLIEIFGGEKIIATLEEKDSLNVVIDDEMKLSFLRYAYKLIDPCIEEEYLKIASMKDIACLKSLVYFDDIPQEDILFKGDFKILRKDVEVALEKQAKALILWFTKL